MCVLLCLSKELLWENILLHKSHLLDMVSAFDLFPVRSNFDQKYHPTVPSNLSLSNLYKTSVLTEFLIIKMRIFRDTVCKQHEYQNIAPKKIHVVFPLFKIKIIDARDFAIVRINSKT